LFWHFYLPLQDDLSCSALAIVERLDATRFSASVAPSVALVLVFLVVIARCLFEEKSTVLFYDTV